MITTKDWQDFKEWASDGHYDNGDYTLIDRVLSELISHYEQTLPVKRLSPRQRALLVDIQQSGERTIWKADRTVNSLLKRGLIVSRWEPPQPGNDYGGSTIYSLTIAGERALKS